ncbi:MAG: nucleotidyltransferase domain-containing protein [Candidatus Hermodarchaeota archaeon]
MPKEKIERQIGRIYHSYNKEEKELLSIFRSKATSLLSILEESGIKAFIHGSVARGDVSNTSDIDIHIPIQISSFRLELLNNFDFADRRIIMGTPNSTIRGLLIRNDKVSISFPLSTPRERETEFFLFSGLLYNEDLNQNIRTAGVTKQLLLIEPEGDGYWISSLIANKKRAIKILNISQQIIEERIRVLERRDRIGRTGLLLNYALSPNENFEQALKQIADRNVIVRRMLKRNRN